MNIGRQKNRVLHGFTLIELMVVIAILGTLAALAVPAYNTYTTKSKFTEVMVATNPTKTAIAACATSGDCVNNNAIALSVTTGASGLAGLTNVDGMASSAIPAANLSEAAVYAAGNAADMETDESQLGYTQSQAQAAEDKDVQMEAQYNRPWTTGQNLTSQEWPSSGTAPYWSVMVVETSPNGQWVCIIPESQMDRQSCPDTPTSGDISSNYMSPIALFLAELTPANDPYYSSYPANTGTTTTLDLPCVGANCCAPATKYVASVVYDSSGVITGTATSFSGLDQETVTLTPSYASGRVDWTTSGSCKTRAGGALC